jgi:hypothetical protein
MLGILLITQGCIFSPSKGNGGVVIPPAVYVKPTSPENVLANLHEAYTHRDTTEYKSLYSDDFKGTFLDQNDPSPQITTYFKTDEAMHIAFIALHPNISVSLVITGNPFRIVDLNDPPGWITINGPFTNLSIGDWYINPGGEDTIDMKFAPVPPSVAGGDTTWVIKQVVETRRSINGS